MHPINSSVYLGRSFSSLLSSVSLTTAERGGGRRELKMDF